MIDLAAVAEVNVRSLPRSGARDPARRPSWQSKLLWL